MWIATQVVWLALLSGGAAPSPPVADSALCSHALPEGWAYVPRWSRDYRVGYYHDAVSGAFIWEAGADEMLAKNRKTSEADTHKVGTAYGREYYVVRFADARGAEVERHLTTLRDYYPFRPAEEEQQLEEELGVWLPPEGTPSAAVSFQRAEGTLNFSSVFATALQEARVMAFLLERPAPSPDPCAPVQYWYSEPAALEEERFEAVLVGAPYQLVVSELGPPERADRAWPDGFSLSYAVRNAKGVSAGVLTFSRDQRVTGKRRVGLEERQKGQ